MDAKKRDRDRTLGAPGHGADPTTPSNDEHREQRWALALLAHDLMERERRRVAAAAFDRGPANDPAETPISEGETVRLEPPAEPVAATGGRAARWLRATLLLLGVLAVATGLAAWKSGALRAAAAVSHQEPIEVVTSAVARDHVDRSSTTSIGTVLARRSITLRNEVAGRVERVQLAPGTVVEAGAVLVQLDDSVERAELAALEAQAALAEANLDRYRQASLTKAVSELEVDRARAERDVARAQIARLRAVIDRKTIRAPFAARVGLADVHPGQVLDAGTVLTTLQGLDRWVHVDFAVAQAVAAGLSPGAGVDVYGDLDDAPIAGEVVAVDARIDPNTRNALVRARVEAAATPAPGASVRVRVPVGEPRRVVAVPASALRTGPEGDHVFVLAEDENGDIRARLRAVERGSALDDEVVIEAGLAAGERVAATGAFKLREAVLVAAEPMTTASAEPADGRADGHSSSGGR